MDSQQTSADDGGLGQALGEASQQRRAAEARERAHQEAEAARRAAHLRAIKQALAAQDERTTKAVTAFLGSVRVDPVEVSVGAERMRKSFMRGGGFDWIDTHELVYRVHDWEHCLPEADKEHQEV